MLKVNNLKFAYKNMDILDGISFNANPGEITVILGANGCGKTTLLNCINGRNKYTGEIIWKDKNIHDIEHDDFHEIFSYLDQNITCNASLTVFEVILLGRLNKLGFRVGEDDIKRVEYILKLLEIEKFSDRNISELSGGQKQLVFIAQALVRNPEILVMDEPTSALDLNHQFYLLDFLKNITKEKNYTTILTLHHLDMAARYADKLLIIKDKKVYADGRPSEVYTTKMLGDIYKVESEVFYDENNNQHIIATGSLYRKQQELRKEKL